MNETASATSLFASSSFRITFLIHFLNLSTDFLNAKPGITFCISLRTYKEDIRDFTQVIIE